MLVAGVDGCPEGWLAVLAEASERLRVLDIFVRPTFADVLARTEGYAAVGVDVPIGLMDAGLRLADAEARKLLKGRASCVFPSAIRPVLGITDYFEACNVSFAAQGKRIPKRAFTLGLRSHELDQLMTPALQQRVFEVHPEVCFWALNGRLPVMRPKRTPEGEFVRLQLLSAVFAGDLGTIDVPKGAARDDLYDACVAAWTAARYARGEFKRLPADPPLDARGLRMEIVF